MRQIGHRIGKFLTLMLTLVAVSGCFGFEFDKTGTPISFSASTYKHSLQDNRIQTRTVFTDEVVDGRERIDWVNGDQILIYMYSDNGNEGDVTQDNKAYVITGIKPDGYKSVAQVYPVGDTLTWSEGKKHSFVGVYPASYTGDYTSGKRHNDHVIQLNLPDIQNGEMENCFLAAMTNYYDRGQRVTLDFYPMVTTLYFILVNDTEETQSVRKVELEQKNYWGAPLVGKYDVAARIGNQFTPRGYGWNGTQKLTLNVNKTIAPGASYGIPAFIIPSERPTGNIYADITLSDKKLSNSLSNKVVSNFESMKKYNLKVKLSGEGTEIEPEPEIPVLPPVSIDSLGDGACQVIYAAIKPGLQEKFRELLGNDFINEKVDKMPKPVTAKAFYEMFSEDEIRTILEYLQKAPEVSVTYDSGITSDIDAEDLLRLIPCCRTLTLRIENDVTIKMKGMPMLQTINVEGNGKIIIYADECPYLKTTTWWDKQKQNGSGIYIDGVWNAAK